MRTALVFGGSGQVGAALLPRLRDAGWQVTAVSRDVQADIAWLHWLRGDLAHCDGLPAAVDAIFSCGPLDHFAAWYARSTLVAPRVLAFGSTSATVKRDSMDPHERDLARRLREGERQVHEAAAMRGGAATLLRPTLMYGAGRDRTLSRLVALAQRLGWLLVPRGADGLRQPVHVDDLAAAALAACDAPATFGNGYDLPGGETLSWREMVARTLASLDPSPRLVQVPAPLFALAMRGARLLGKGEGFGDAAIARLREDLVFDAGPAQRDFGYAPRRFRP
jgi:nucleoside-diphosphate-sugar epimerase